MAGARPGHFAFQLIEIKSPAAIARYQGGTDSSKGSGPESQPAERDSL
jgi:hypothetical protein